MEILIFGGSGFVGQHLAKYLEQAGYEVWVPTRTNNTLRYGKGILYKADQVQSLLEERNKEYAIINLAGETIDSRWTQKRKKQIIDSRELVTRGIADAICNVKHKPKLLLNASAVGYYGYSDVALYTEESNNGSGFLAEVTRRWEAAANVAQNDTRVVIARMGIVLGREGGPLPRMVMPYRFFVGGKVGTGKQWVSWIHIEDLCSSFHYLIEEEKVSGAVNITAPEPVQMNEFGRAIGAALHRPHWFPVPSFAMRFMMGDMSEIVLQGHRVIPNKLLNSGYTFKFTTITSALQALLKSP